MLQIVRQRFIDEGVNVQDIDRLETEWQDWVGTARKYREAGFASIPGQKYCTVR
jgi:hypothetical protein